MNACREESRLSLSPSNANSTNADRGECGSSWLLLQVAALPSATCPSRPPSDGLPRASHQEQGGLGPHGVAHLVRGQPRPSSLSLRGLQSQYGHFVAFRWDSRDAGLAGSTPSLAHGRPWEAGQAGWVVCWTEQPAHLPGGSPLLAPGPVGSPASLHGPERGGWRHFCHHAGLWSAGPLPGPLLEHAWPWHPGEGAHGACGRWTISVPPPTFRESRGCPDRRDLRAWEVSRGRQGHRAAPSRGLW